MQKVKKWNTYDVVFVGVLSAVVFVANFWSIPLGDVTRIHFGNVFCILAGLLLGSVRGGLCAGLGGFFFDLFNPLYAATALFTFVFKFVLGFLAGKIAHSGGRKGTQLSFNILGGVAGSVAYVILYLSKSFAEQYFIIKNPMSTVLMLMLTKGIASLVNAVIAVACAVLIAPAFRMALSRSGIGKKLSVQS